MKKYKSLLIVMLSMLPSIVYGKSLFSDGSDLSLGTALSMQGFITIHMSVFVLLPLSRLLAKDGNGKKLFWKMFLIRWGILLFFDFFITTNIAIIDMFAIFIGAFIIVPFATIRGSFKNKSTIVNTQISEKIPNVTGIVLKCASCGANLTLNHKFCTSCGRPFDGNNVKVEMGTSDVPLIKQEKFVSQKDFDPIFSLPEDNLVEEFLNKELVKAGVDKDCKLIPSDILKKKKIFNLIFSLLVFIYTVLIFFHFPFLTYIIGIVILFIFFKMTRNYNLMKYLKKQLKLRPSEKISNIVMSVKNTFVPDNSRKALLVSIFVAVTLPLIIFINPRILYEKTDGGYAVRYYAFGISNFTTATIPETYKNENVISLRGNTFSNMPFLKDVNLPDTIIEIRGQAFKNNINLTTVKLPNNLNYLGGGAFYNCTSLTTIEIPNSVTYIGGEAFYNAKNLKSIKLSNNLTEIRGSTFENCSSLESIEIPDSVTRIGGHAFYGNSSLSAVTIGINSKLTEIGSSAFRRCSRLYEITLPNNVYVNERAFKESPTTKKYYNEYRCNQYGCY